VEVVEAALSGGVTVVQYRDKVSDTSVLVSTARKLHAVTQKHNVPLLINDRVDVALAVGCEGVHIGQDDLGMCHLTSHVFAYSPDLKQTYPAQENYSERKRLSA
jgi:thiamine-phosphate diphosphorylase